MYNCELFKKAVAWSLIASMINPALIAPAFARDSDIYLATTVGTSTAEPNVLFILGTNDRMNVAEAWREYDPLVYDSHAEYLWNDVNIISPFEVLAENANAISDAAPPVNPFSPWGTWSGALNTDRRALWQATLAYANGTQGTDPGPRTTYRNYWLGSWHYWAPTGTATTDPKLWSVSFNRFLGFVQTVPGARGGVTFPGTTGNYTGVNDFRSSNACTASLTQIEPSTIFAPTGRALNAGFMLNQQWVRYEPYLGLQAINNPATNYPGNHTTANVVANTSSSPSVTTFYRGYVDGVSGAPTNTAAPAEPTNVYRDSLGGGIGSQGLPIRRQRGPNLAALPAVTSPTAAPDGVRSYAGWTDPKADLGGFVFQSWTAATSVGYYYPQTVLAALRGVYGYSLGAAGLAAVPAGSLANEQFSAWLGNRDGAPAFGSMVGVPGYYDTTVTSCNPASGPSVANKCIQYSSGSSTYAISQSCTPMGAVKKETDASGTVRYTQAAAACNPTGGATCTVNGSGQPMSTCTGAPASLTAPACSLLTSNTFSTTTIAANCSYGGGTVVNVNPCGWSGRQSVYIEGQGTYFYGGTCGENGGGATYNFGQPNATCTVPNGATPYAATKTLNGVSQATVLGPYASPPPANGLTTLGCGNSVGPGSYRYGGTCSGGAAYQMPTFNNSQVPGALPVPPVPNATVPGPAPARQLIGSGPNPVGTRAAICAAPSAGAALNIRNAGVQTYNRTCNNNYSNVGSCLGWYGSLCQPNSTPSANCQTPVVNSVAAGATGQWYQAYNLQATGPTGFVHECLADSAANNGGTNIYPTSFMRPFGTAFNTASTTNATTNLAQGYTTGGGPQQYTVDASKNIDVYSTNYMNFLYGAKACRDSSSNLITTSPVSTPPAGATCSPIARKTRLQVAKDALSGLVTTTDGVRLGLMVYNKTDTTTADEGGNIVYAVRRMGGNSGDLPAYNNRASLVTAIQGVVASSRTPLTETMYEAYRYFAGRTPTFGTLGTAAQGGGSVSAGREATVGVNIDPPSAYGNVFVTNGGGTYNSPMLNNPNVAGPANCQKNYIVMITNGQPEEDASANAAIKTMAYAAATGATVAPRTDFDTNGATPNNAGAPDYRQIPTVAGGSPYGPTDAAGTAADGGFVWLDELTYFMATADVSPGAANYQSEYSSCASPSGTHICNGPTTTDLISGRQSIITYTIGFAGISAPVVQNAAVVSGGVYYIAQNAQQLQAALTAAFIAIVSYDATTAAVTVPISSLNRGVSSSDIYLAFFAPSAASVWPGTVKKFQLSTLDSDCGVGIAPCLIGQTLVNGVYNIETHDPVTGQGVVDPTVTSGPNDTLHPPGSAWYASTVQDGSKPNKGGTGHVLVNTAGYTPDQRKIYTYLTDSVALFTAGSLSTSTTLTNANNAVDYNNNRNNINRCRLGDAPDCPGGATMSRATQETLISYIRGGNLGDSQCTDGAMGTTCSTWTSWPHTGVEHSKPAVVTYDSTDPINGQFMFYLQTNGMLTAVNTRTGKEQWSFLVEEALPKLQAMQTNANGPEIYAADGDPVVYYDDQNGDGIINGADRVWIYFGLRRGGKVYYALDITNKISPIFKWKITNETGAGKVCNGTSTCSAVAAYNELGQTWSTPAIAKIKYLFGATNNPPALIFGGGYDPGEDSVPPSSRTMGRAVYVVNGNDGSVIQSWGAGAQTGSYRTGGTIATYAIPSAVTAINADYDGQNYADRLLVGDLGGNVWRFDIDDPVPANWRGLQLASLSNNPVAEPKRKFFFQPAVALQNATGFDFHAVYIGSGDKEHPLLTTATMPATTDDVMFMLMDDPSLNSGGGTPTAAGPSALATPITPSTLTAIANIQTTGVSAASLIGTQGWFRRLDIGEKVINAAAVFKFQLSVSRLTFGTYAPTSQLNACTPPGEGRLNEIDSLTGDLIQLNGAALPPSRYFTDFKGRGYVSSSQSLILDTAAGRQSLQVVCIGPSCKFQPTGTLGAPTKIYWYMEPEQ